MPIEKVTHQISELEYIDLIKFRQKINEVEGQNNQKYFTEIFKLIPVEIHPDARKKWRA